jgi:hypothetical protein
VSAVFGSPAMVVVDTSTPTALSNSTPTETPSSTPTEASNSPTQTPTMSATRVDLGGAGMRFGVLGLLAALLGMARGGARRRIRRPGV